MTHVLTGAHIKVYINNKLYKPVQNIMIDVDYGVVATKGIDAVYAQELATTSVTVKGRVAGLRLKNSGGIQAHNMRALFMDINASPYISIRIQDRQSGEDIIYIPQAMISKENHQIGTKGSYKLNFDFEGIVPLFALDRVFT